MNFKEVMEIEGAAVLMTAHHLDDQAETILMKLIRGTNFSHSAGIKETSFCDRGIDSSVTHLSKRRIVSICTAPSIRLF